MRSPDPMLEFYHKYKKIFLDFGVDVDKAVTVNGCFKTNKVTLQRTMIPETNSIFAGFPSMALIKKKEKGIKAVIRKIKIPQLPKAEKEDMLSCSFNMKTYPGFHLKEYFNCNTKGDAISIANKIAIKRWEKIDEANFENRIVRRNEIFPNTYTVGARNKRDFTYDDFSEVTSRAVHMPEFHSELNSAAWIDPITDYIKYKKRGCIYIGNSFIDYQRLIRDTKYSQTILEGDIKRFDSSLYITDIIIATALCRLFYDINDESIDNHFIAMFDTIGIKDYITPGGYIYRLIHGLPSGVKSTSLLGSLINNVNLAHCCEFKNLKKVNFIVGGDDFLISFFEKEGEYGINKILSNADRIGINFKFLKIKDFNSIYIEDRPCFYKYTIDRGEPVVPTSTVLERVFIPWNKSYDTNYSILTFLFDLFPSLAAPRSSLLLFYIFFSEMYEKVTSTKLPLSKIINMHKGIYEGVMSNNISLVKEIGIHYTVGMMLSRSDILPSIEIDKIYKFYYNEEECLYPSFAKRGMKISSL